MTLQQPLLVIAKSARMMTHYLNQQGHSVVALDCFADSDCQQAAEHTYKLESLAYLHVMEAVEHILSMYSIRYCMYGSGLESHLDSLRYLQSKFILLGNSADIVQQVEEKPLLFKQLQQWGVDFPETRFACPDTPHGWLFKPLQGEGGIHINRLSDVDKNAPLLEGYWQRYQPGISCSLLFLAADGDVNVLGVQRQLLSDQHKDFPFLFAGLVVEDFCEKYEVVVSWAKSLTETYSLSGLNSLDFIVHKEKCFFLEINPRISASIQLYEESVMTAHIESILSRKIPEMTIKQRQIAYKVIFAEQDTRIECTNNWPEWCVDRPPPGSIISQGQPICSIIAKLEFKRLLSTVLQQQEQAFADFLKQGKQSNAI